MNDETALGIQEETEPGQPPPRGSGEKPWDALCGGTRKLTGPRGEQMGVKEFLRDYESMLKEANELDRQLALRRNLLDGKPMIEESEKNVPTDVLELRKLLAMARIDRAEAARMIGIARRTMNEKLSGKRKFKHREMTELADMAEARIAEKWT